jgi:hypothetical protein
MNRRYISIVLNYTLGVISWACADVLTYTVDKFLLIFNLENTADNTKVNCDVVIKLNSVPRMLKFWPLKHPENLMLPGYLAVLYNSTPTLINTYESDFHWRPTIISYKSNPDDMRD